MIFLISGRDSRRAAVLALALGCVTATGLRAQGGATAAISGRVADSGGKPLALATIWLVPADTSALSRGALTDTAGAFAFERLAAGRYYLRVDRVGFQSEWSDAKPLAAGQHMALAVTSAPPPIVLGRIRASGTCRTGADMAADTPLATVWGEARKAAAARRLFDLSYRYGVDLRERVVRYAVPSCTSRDARHQLTSTPTAAPPASRGDDVSIGWGSHGFWGKEQARAWARYGPFVRDTAAP
jgi:hypothetical protein